LFIHDGEIDSVLCYSMIFITARGIKLNDDNNSI